MKDNQNSQVADKKKITFEFCPHLVSFVKKQMIKGLPLKKKKKIEALMILIEKKPKRAKKQFRRNVALLFLSYYRPLSVCLSLSLCVRPKFSYETKKKFHTHNSSTAKPTFYKEKCCDLSPSHSAWVKSNFHKSEIPFHYFHTNVKTTLIYMHSHLYLCCFLTWTSMKNITCRPILTLLKKYRVIKIDRFLHCFHTLSLKHIPLAINNRRCNFYSLLKECLEYLLNTSYCIWNYAQLSRTLYLKIYHLHQCILLVSIN